MVFSANDLAAFFGWCTIINTVFLVLAAFSLIFFRSLILPLHSRMFGASEDALSIMYIQYLAIYKIAILTLNLTPYLALRFMT